MNKLSSNAIFRDRNKEAAFWEKNIKQIWKKGKPVKIKFAKNLSETVNIRFDPSSIKAIRNHAREKGLGITQLIRMWTMEKLHAA